jgi:hypothetical protein
MRERASRRPTFSTHSRKIDASISVSRQKASRMFGRARQRPHRRHRNARDPGPRDRLHVMIRAWQHQRLQRDDIAGEMEGNDLTPAIAGRFLAAGKAVQQDGAMGRFFPVAHQIGVGPHRSHVHRQRTDRRPILLVEQGETLKLDNGGTKDVVVSRHATSPRFNRKV